MISITFMNGVKFGSYILMCFVFKYHLNGTILEHVSCYNDLGVTVDKGLVFNNHVSNVINKCNKVNGMIRRSLGYRALTSVSFNFIKLSYSPLLNILLQFGLRSPKFT